MFNLSSTFANIYSSTLCVLGLSPFPKFVYDGPCQCSRLCFRISSSTSFLKLSLVFESYGLAAVEPLSCTNHEGRAVVLSGIVIEPAQVLLNQHLATESLFAVRR